MPEALPLEIPKRPPQVLRLVPYDVRTEVPICPCLVAVGTYALGKVQSNSNWQDMKLPRECNQRLSSLGLYVGRVDHGEFPCSQALRRDEVKHLERVFRNRLIILIVADETATEV